MTEAEAAYAQVMSAVIEDPDRSIEGAITRGIKAGIIAERQRIRAVIGLPAARGLESAAIALALSGGCSIEVAEQLLAAHAPPPTPITNAEACARRAAFKIIHSQSEEINHACEAP